MPPSKSRYSDSLTTVKLPGRTSLRGRGRGRGRPRKKRSSSLAFSDDATPEVFFDVTAEPDVSVEDAAASLLAAADDGSDDTDVDDVVVASSNEDVPIASNRTEDTTGTSSNDEDAAATSSNEEATTVAGSNGWDTIGQYLNKKLTASDDVKLRGAIERVGGQYKADDHTNDYFAALKKRLELKQEQGRKIEAAPQPKPLPNNYSSPYAASSPAALLPTPGPFTPIIAGRRPGPQPRVSQPKASPSRTPQHDTIMAQVLPQNTVGNGPTRPLSADSIQRRQIVLNCAPRAKRRTLHGIMGKGEIINHLSGVPTDDILRNHPHALKGGTLLAIREELVKQRAGRGWGQLLLEKYEAVYGCETGMKVNSIYKATGMAQALEREDEEAHAAAGRKKRCLRCFEKRVLCSIREDGTGVPCRQCCTEGSDPWCFVPQDDLPAAQTTPITNQPIIQPMRVVRSTPPTLPPQPVPAVQGVQGVQGVQAAPAVQVKEDIDDPAAFDTAGEGEAANSSTLASPGAMDVDEPVRREQTVVG